MIRQAITTPAPPRSLDDLSYLARSWHWCWSDAVEPQAADLHLLWSGCRDSNPGPSVPQTDALTKLRHSP